LVVAPCLCPLPVLVSALPLLQLLPTGPGTCVWSLQFVNGFLYLCPFNCLHQFLTEILSSLISVF
jgi:hypothetical protein